MTTAKYTYSFIVDSYLVEWMVIRAKSPKEARDKIRARYKGRKCSSFILQSTEDPES